MIQKYGNSKYTGWSTKTIKQNYSSGFPITLYKNRVKIFKANFWDFIILWSEPGQFVKFDVFQGILNLIYRQIQSKAVRKKVNKLH